MEYKIKKLSGDDISIAQQLFILFKKVFDGEEISLSDLPDEEYINRVLAKDGFHVFVALVENKVVGGLTAYELDMYMKKDKEIYLYDLAVEQQYRRQGIARLLIASLKGYARENNISTIFVEAHDEDVEAVEFYKSLNGQMEAVSHFNIDTHKD